MSVNEAEKLLAGAVSRFGAEATVTCSAAPQKSSAATARRAQVTSSAGCRYNRVATLIERMEKEGVISTANAAGKRDILLDVVDED